MPSTSSAPVGKPNTPSTSRSTNGSTNRATASALPKKPLTDTKAFADRVLAVSKKSENVKQGGILMADGSLRTKDHVIIKPAGWQNSSNPVVKAWRAVRRQYLKVTLRWPRWARRVAFAVILSVLIANASVLIYVVGRTQLLRNSSASLPTTGIVDVDGSKYYVEKAEWQYAGVLNGWSIDNAPTNNGKIYKSSDGTCSMQVLSDSLNNGSTQLDVLTVQARDKYLNMPKGVKVEAELANSTIRATGGEQEYAFLRHRYNFESVDSVLYASEIYLRTLANKSFMVIQTCETSAWDQSQAARDSISQSLRIAAR